MHATKCGWVGQTFALAKSNDSAEKKSRIRRSKEERKAMVESFIHKYQKLNNGSFPSLNLTHKEVGGSFYTVREIVRDIIQENRVLGPAKLTAEEQNFNRSLEQYPLGSIAAEAHLSSLSSNEAHSVTHILPNHHQVINEELVVKSSERYSEPEYLLSDDGKVINGSSQAVEKIVECDVTITSELLGSKSMDVEENHVDVRVAKANGTYISADVEVETFPVRPIVKVNYDMDEESSEMRDLTGATPETELVKMEQEVESNYPVLDNTNCQETQSALVIEKAEVKPASLSLEENCCLVDNKKSKSFGDPLFESSNGSTTREGSALNFHSGKDLEAASSTEVKSMSAPKEIHGKSLKHAETSKSSGQSTSNEAILTENNPEVQHVGKPHNESNSSLNRINLESWEGPSEKSSAPNENPVLALVKGFITAFVKFWTE